MMEAYAPGVPAVFIWCGLPKARLNRRTTLRTRGDPVRIPARLRYRVQSGSISWFYQLYRWQFWLRDQVKNDLDTVKQKTLLPTFEGSPEA